MLDLPPIEGESERRFEPIDPKDRALIQAFRDGDRDACKEIFELLVKPLTYFVENIVFDPLVAEDLVADTFTKLFNAREKFRSIEHIKRWLYVVARNSGIDHIRHKANLNTLHKELRYLQSGEENNIETERVKTAVFAELLKGIEDLAPQRKVVMEMYFIQEKGTQEIAEELGLNTQTVLNHKSKGLQKLREYIFKRRNLWEMVLILVLTSPQLFTVFVYQYFPM